MKVAIEDWVIECCLDPPAVGQQVEWHLQFREGDPRDYGDPTSLERLECTASELAAWEGATLGRAPVLLNLPGAALYWEAPQASYGPVNLVGRVHVAQHGEVPEVLPPTRGHVVRIRMAHTLYEEVPQGSRSWQPVEPLDVVYEDLQVSPKWFGHDSAPRADRRERLGNSLLVDLDVSRE